ncbi:MAG TPA: 50S ribosomal protein L9 [Gammaproteobacteria bacterium]|nr:50S ribosomal protein L9 [Gammaproteobacteria bacterium]
MEVILLERVRNLGNVGDKVSVKGGFGRNFLIPNGKAVFATRQNVKEFEARRAELEKAAEEAKAAAQVVADAIGGLALEISRKAGEGGKLFGSVSAQDVANALAEKGHDVEKKSIHLTQGDIRETGSYTADVNLHADVVASLTLEVVAE